MNQEDVLNGKQLLLLEFLKRTSICYIDFQYFKTEERSSRTEKCLFQNDERKLS